MKARFYTYRLPSGSPNSPSSSWSREWLTREMLALGMLATYSSWWSRWSMGSRPAPS